MRHWGLLLSRDDEAWWREFEEIQSISLQAGHSWVRSRGMMINGKFYFDELSIIVREALAESSGKVKRRT